MLRLAFLCFFAFTFTAVAQTFSISGTVVDPTGAGVPGAQVTIHKTDGAYSRTAASDSSGAFRFSARPPGSFEVLVQSEAFTPEKTEIKIADRAPAPLRITLKLADVRQE